MKKKFYTLTYGLSLVFCLGLVVLSGCSKDDDDPDPEPVPAKPVLSFKTSVVTVNEADGQFEIEVVLDQPAPANLSVDLLFGGSATNGDIQIEDDEITIEKGATSGKLLLEVYSDLRFEDDEAFIIQIDDVSGGDVTVSRDDQLVVVIQQENGLVVVLEWAEPNEESGNFADMDIVVYGAEDEESLEATEESAAGVSGFHDVWPVEFVFIPQAVNFSFGLAYPYAYGNYNPLEFTVRYLPYEDGELSSTPMFQSTGSYTPANKNFWREDVENPDFESTVIVQTITVEDGDYSDPGDEIDAPGAGSRMRVPKANLSGMQPFKKSFDGKFESTPFKGSSQQQLWERLSKR